MAENRRRLHRAHCTCGRTIWKGPTGRLTGAGLAQYWVVTDNPTWRHTNDHTPACNPPGDYAQTGHLRTPDFLWTLALLLAILLMLKALGVRW